MVVRDWPPRASLMADLSVGSTLKASAMHCEATSRESFSSAETVPSVEEMLRKSMMARASLFLDSDACMG